MSIDGKMMMLRAQLYTAMQTLEGDKLREFWDLIEEIRESGGVLRFSAERRGSSVLQDWVMVLPLREQGTLVAAVRGCDLATKQPLDGPARRLTCWFRWTFMNPADPREVDIPGSFFSSQPPHIKGSDFDAFPMHWYAHITHGVEVVAYRHPNSTVRSHAFFVYTELVHHLHLPLESKEQMIARLSEDRIAAGTVVS